MKGNAEISRDRPGIQRQKSKQALHTSSKSDDDKRENENDVQAQIESAEWGHDGGTAG